MNQPALKLGSLSISRQILFGCLSILLFMSAMLLHTTTQANVSDGDITLDGEVGIPDYLHGLQYLHGSRALSGDAVLHGDVAPLLNGVPDPDGVLNTADILILLRMILYGINFSYPSNQFNIGDSIGEAESSEGSIGEPFHEHVWSTGYDGADTVDAFNERYESVFTAGYYENNAMRDPVFNHAQSGAVMADFAAQAQGVVTAVAALPEGRAGMVTMLLGNNDVCAPTNADMTDPGLFETQFRAGLDVLAGDGATRLAQIHVSGIPAIYWLWTAKRTNFICSVFIWPQVPCQNLLDNPGDDCANSASRSDPDNDYPGDGSDCLRRKIFHRLIRDNYNSVLQSVTDEYRGSGILPNIRYTDIYDVQFTSIHVNNSDCFHPSVIGHALLAEKSWCRTHWSMHDAQCTN
jgi:hypothetical protein